MRRNDGTSDKIAMLRSVETYGYQVAYYVLQDHQLAAEAAKAVLLALSKDESFFCACLEAQREKIRLLARQATLAVRKRPAAIC